MKPIMSMTYYSYPYRGYKYSFEEEIEYDEYGLPENKKVYHFFTDKEGNRTDWNFLPYKKPNKKDIEAFVDSHFYKEHFNDS